MEVLTVNVATIPTTCLGSWSPGQTAPAFAQDDLTACVANLRETACVVQETATGRIGVGYGGQVGAADDTGYVWLASLPPTFPEWLGDRSFLAVHGVRFPYIAGEMANGIATTAMVIAMGQAGMLGFFGSAGLSPDRVAAAIDTIEAALGRDGAAYGVNLIHSPNEPLHEARMVDLFLRRGVRRVSASAFMTLTPNIVRYAYTGLTEDAQGRIRRHNHVFAKLSRPEVARHFMSPAPVKMLQALVTEGLLTEQ
ncbi:MAG: 2-nitropropane dioxygenase, partial [Candidatus Sericytochromatia bacterium]|nr:2-nitropropane dioxygenase [Candidatus Sericytochromatia bacterium]